MKRGMGEVTRDFDRGYMAGQNVAFMAGLGIGGLAVALIVAAAWWLL